MTAPCLPVSALLLALAMVACATPRAQSTSDNEALLARAESAIARGDARGARAALGAVAADKLTAPQRQRLQVAEAELALGEGHPVVALQGLPAPGELRDARLALRAEGARAQALFRMGDAIGGTQALVAREALIADPQQHEINRAFLWDELRVVDLDTASGPRLARADPVTRGWIELAVISRSVWLDPHDLEARIAQWRQDHRDHPADDRIAGLAQPQSVASRRRIDTLALLLPLTGPHAASAEAVRDGFFAAYYGTPQDQAPRPAARVYDTGSTPEALLSAYRAALDDGAEFLVGPLTREDVAVLADDGRPPVPVLALNYLDPGRQAPFNFFQWGLAPEDEARQAAERAVADRQYRAIAFVPEGEWGDRVLRAFRERLESLGGAVVASRTYVATDRDYSQPIRTLLAIDMSDARHNALTNALGVKSGFQPRRRDDVDLVFVAARPEQARLIGPQFRFHRTGELPIYATSLIYDGEPPAADLNGLRFCDMPWMFATDGPFAALRSQLRTLFPARPRDYTRLLALGYDAYTLVTLIESGQLQPGSFFPAASGTLSLREDRVIVRGLACAEIRNGRLAPLDVALAPPPR